MRELKSIFDQIFREFSEEVVSLFSEAFKQKGLKKGEYFLREGRICNHIGFIKNGAMMCYYLKDGKRYIDEFSLDYEFITDYSSLLNQRPSNKNIQCIEGTEIFIISKDKLNDLYKKNNVEFERLGRTMAEQLYLQWHEKSKSLLMDNATERYIKLIENRTELPQRVPMILPLPFLNFVP
jgi:CRP-like cAMP-binding protein